jgi:hypothetical protein
MAQWGNTDDAANSVLWATTAVNKTPNTVNQTALFGNTTVGAFTAGEAVGQFGLDATEIRVSGNAAVQQYIITNAGSGYAANATVSVANTTGGANTLAANSTVTAGKVTALTANGTTIRGYTAAPAVTIAAPALIIFNGNTAVTPNTTTGAFIAISTANSFLAVGDKLVYAGNATSTPATLTDTRPYYVSFANTTGIKLSDEPNTANINFAKASGDNTTAGGATLQGETATAVAELTETGYTKGAAHTGWVLRTVGTGGRAGRVQYETLVAMGGTFSTDASDDTILPDA